MCPPTAWLTCCCSQPQAHHDKHRFQQQDHHTRDPHPRPSTHKTHNNVISHMHHQPNELAMANTCGKCTSKVTCEGETGRERPGREGEGNKGKGKEGKGREGEGRGPRGRGKGQVGEPRKEGGRGWWGREAEERGGEGRAQERDPLDSQKFRPLRGGWKGSGRGPCGLPEKRPTKRCH